VVKGHQTFKHLTLKLLCCL